MIWSIVSAVLGGVWAKLIAIGAAALGVLGIYLKGRSDAKARAKLRGLENARRAENDRLKADEDAARGAAAERLRRDWSRD
jgi:hypothetical protein